MNETSRGPIDKAHQSTSPRLLARSSGTPCCSFLVSKHSNQYKGTEGADWHSPFSKSTKLCARILIAWVREPGTQLHTHTHLHEFSITQQTHHTLQHTSRPLTKLLVCLQRIYIYDVPHTISVQHRLVRGKNAQPPPFIGQILHQMKRDTHNVYIHFITREDLCSHGEP